MTSTRSLIDTISKNILKLQRVLYLLQESIPDHLLLIFANAYSSILSATTIKEESLSLLSMVSIKLLLIHRPLYHNVLELISSQLGDGSVVLVIYAIQNAIIKTRTELVSLLHSSILRLQFIATHFCILRETFEPLKRCLFKMKRNFTSAFEFSILNYNNWTFLFHFISECSDRCKLYKIAYSN